MWNVGQISEAELQLREPYENLSASGQAELFTTTHLQLVDPWCFLYKIPIVMESNLQLM